jgi:hypothetical protein
VISRFSLPTGFLFMRLTIIREELYESINRL